MDKKRLTERLKRLFEYKKLESKPRNGVNSYYNISDESKRSELHLAPNSLDTHQGLINVLIKNWK